MDKQIDINDKGRQTKSAKGTDKQENDKKGQTNEDKRKKAPKQFLANKQTNDAFSKSSISQNTMYNFGAFSRGKLYSRKQKSTNVY